LFKARDLREALQRLCGAYQQRLSGQQLLAPPEALRAAVVSLAVGVILLIALAGYKIAAANAHGRSNIGFLVAEAAAACILLVWIFQRTARRVASKRGKAFLAQAQLAYAGQASALLGRAGDGGAAAASALLLVGLFGFDILKGAPDAAFARAFAQSSGSGGDGGGGCGGGDGGGGCGGCGGGGE